jgi:galactokinase
MNPESAFAAWFGRPPTVRAEAPGRVNLIGEHTDYNGGFVLPTAIPQRTGVALALTAGDEVRAVSRLAPPAETVLTYTLGAERPGRGWLDYLQGISTVLREAGYAVGGFDVVIDSAVPLGSGLSSSAAFEVAVLRALREAFGWSLDDVQLALLGQRAESEFVGARVGVMDQFAASLADVGVALFLDTQTLAYERVPLPPGIDLIVINSGIAHRLAGGDYNTRRAECERACALLQVKELRDLTPADWPRALALPEPLDRRVRHVLTENSRVLAAVGALRAADLDVLGALLDESHASLRDDYEVSIPEIDLLVALAQAEPDVYGARLTGGGFGGSIVAVARAGTGRAVAARVAAAYTAQGDSTATVLLPPQA